jgi:hypothetical protein
MTVAYHPEHYLLLQKVSVFFLNDMVLKPGRLAQAKEIHKTHVNARIPVTFHATATADRRDVFKLVTGPSIKAATSRRGGVRTTFLIVVTIWTRCGRLSLWTVCRHRHDEERRQCHDSHAVHPKIIDNSSVFTWNSCSRPHNRHVTEWPRHLQPTTTTTYGR